MECPSVPNSRALAPPRAPANISSELASSMSVSPAAPITVSQPAHGSEPIPSLETLLLEVWLGSKVAFPAPTGPACSPFVPSWVPGALARGNSLVFKTGEVGRGRTVSRVLYPLRDGDHLSATPVARRL